MQDAAAPPDWAQSVRPQPEVPPSAATVFCWVGKHRVNLEMEIDHDEDTGTRTRCGLCVQFHRAGGGLPRRCKKDIEQKGFTVEDSILEEVAKPANSGTTGYSAWFRVTKCEKGYIIVNMHAGCQIGDHWAAGECETPEIHQAIGEH